MSYKAWILALFCVVWNGMVYSTFRQAFEAESFGSGGLLIPILHLAAGLVLAYVTLAMFLNLTVIRVDAASVMIQHLPVPWKDRRCKIESILQLYVRPEDDTFRLFAVTTYGNRIFLFSSFKKDDVRFVQQAIESYLDLAARQGSDQISS